MNMPPLKEQEITRIKLQLWILLKKILLEFNARFLKSFIGAAKDFTMLISASVDKFITFLRHFCRSTEKKTRKSILTVAMTWVALSRHTNGLARFLKRSADFPNFSEGKFPPLPRPWRRL